MKTLLLLRHAKSSWKDTNVKDFDRPLNQRGLKAAPAVGRLMRKRKLEPKLVLSSPAERARQTTQLVIEFGIAKDGKVPFVTVLRSSGYPIYDDYAVNAVKLASPFPPIPDTFSKKGVPIHATFSYVVESSLANILR